MSAPTADDGGASTPALEALDAAGVPHEVHRFERPRSVEESAARQGIEPGSLVKTLVVRRAEGDYLFVLVGGDRAIDWPKLRRHLGVSRITLPDAEEAREVTGYERGTITPFGATHAWPVIADAALEGHGRVGIGGGAHGVAVHLEAADLVDTLDATVADVTRPAGHR